VVAAGAVVGSCSSGTRRGSTTTTTTNGAAAPTTAVSLAPTTTTLLHPGSLPRPDLPVGTDTLPQIEHIVVVMMENHSFDNYLGLLGRGDGFTLGANGLPTAANTDASGKTVHAFHMPTTCQLQSQPSQSWNATHTQWDGGRNDGFVRSESGPVAMGYWTGADLPFYYGLARTFPLADRWFSSCMAQTYPNRRFLMAGTALGWISDPVPSIHDPLPPNGTVFDLLNAHGISWKNYYSDLPQIAIFLPVFAANKANLAKVDQYFTDAAAGTLPAFSLVDPNFTSGSEENPQDVQQGEAFAAKVINAALHGPAWPKTLLIWVYDEHGGYYDHVPPPPAVKPDDVPPMLTSTDTPGAYDRYGFRVPAAIVSPYARKNYVSHVVHDHTSVLKLVETKWNLPALTYRDANADNLLDSIDLHAPPAFLTPPTLPAPGNATGVSSCASSGPGVIPPPSAVAS
jgi:phospholipase C